MKTIQVTEGVFEAIDELINDDCPTPSDVIDGSLKFGEMLAAKHSESLEVLSKKFRAKGWDISIRTYNGQWSAKVGNYVAGFSHDSGSEPLKDLAAVTAWLAARV